MKTYVSFIVAGDIISPLKHSLRVKCYQTLRTAEKVHALRERATLHVLTYLVLS
jgi:hypothetical protein